MTGISFIIILAQEKASPDELYDIIVLAPEKSIWPLIFYSILGLLIIAGLGIWIWYLMHSRKKASATENATARAHRQLRELALRHEDLDPNRFSLALSDTLKDFLSTVFADPVRFETTQEFLGRIARTGTKLPPAAQQELKEFLIAAEEVKFGNTPDAAAQTLPLLQQARSLVNLCRSINSGERKGD